MKRNESGYFDPTEEIVPQLGSSASKLLK